MAFNVVDFSNFIRSFIVDRIKTNYPDLDTNPNSVFDDLFIKPLIEVITPLIDTLNSLEFKMNLDNAEYMSEEDLDDIGENNYLVKRNQGQKATTTLTLSFTKVSTTDNLIVPAGAVFETESGLKFIVPEKKEFTPTELLTKYNVNNMTYDVDVAVEAENVGNEYNVSENQITVIPSPFNAYLASVTNKVGTTDGIDKEDNVSYADRIRNFYISRHIGTKPGYKQFIIENFTEVNDVFIAGYGDPEMTRDFETFVIPTKTTTNTLLYMYHHGLITGDAIINTTRSTPLIPITLVDVNQVTHPTITAQAFGDAIKKYKKLANMTAATGTTTTTLKLTGHGLSTGDYIRNITRGNLTSAVTVVDADTLTVTSITGQASGDTIERYKFNGNDVANIGLFDAHYGGKVDIYIKGCDYETREQIVSMNSPRLKLSQPYSKITLGSIIISNVNDATKTPETSSITQDADGNCIILLNNTDDVSYDHTVVGQIKVSYNYDAGGTSAPKDDFFTVGPTSAVLETPFRNIASITDLSTAGSSYGDAQYYTISRTLFDGTVIDESSIYVGTSYENVQISLRNMDDVINGSSISIKYTVNQTLAGLKTNFDIDENRIITTDLLFKEAQSVFVNLGFNVKVKDGQSLDDVKLLQINNALADYFLDLKLGDSVQESDIVGYLYKNEEINKIIEYIALPFTSFYIADTPADPIAVGRRDGTVIGSGSTQYLVLNKTNIQQIS